MIARTLTVLLAPTLMAPAALAQQGGVYTLTWSTIDGGGQMWSAGGEYSLGGTIGQPDAGSSGAPGLGIDGGFWPALGPVCRADVDNSGTLTLADFITFRNLYVAGDLGADYDGNGTLTLNDFVQFRNAYVAGCP